MDKTIVYGAISQFYGQVSVFNYQGGPNYKDLYPHITQLELNANCISEGVIGVLPGLIGIIQATEVIKLIIGIGNILSGRVWSFCGFFRLLFYNNKKKSR